MPLHLHFLLPITFFPQIFAYVSSFIIQFLVLLFALSWPPNLKKSFLSSVTPFHITLYFVGGGGGGSAGGVK